MLKALTNDSDERRSGNVQLVAREELAFRHRICAEAALQPTAIPIENNELCSLMSARAIPDLRFAYAGTILREFIG